ncbi:MAG: hypothetical protein AAFX87_11260 [Bacteroidota bacterium]
MRIITLITVCLFSVTLALAGGVNDDKERAQEIRKEMWTDSGADFKVVDVPDKWAKEDAVIIAKDSRRSYHKDAVVARLRHKRYNHYRIKLQSSSAIEEYSEFSVPGSGSLGNLFFEFYAGFKVIKSSGEEVIIPLSKMVKEKAELNNSSLDIYKLAVPNLKVGDIIDYYIAEERKIMISSKFYPFDPAIYELNDKYPIMKQRISFDVLRRCFINLKTLNGAPEFELTSDSKNDRNTYVLEDGERESVDNVRWLHNYREIPTVKFKVTYASGAAANLPTFIGEPGILKSKVSVWELEKFMGYLFRVDYYTSAGISGMIQFSHGKINDKEKLAEHGFYALRFLEHIASTESKILDGKSVRSPARYSMVKKLSAFYRDQGINHQVLIGIPRYISSLDDLILENELTYAIKINEGAEPVYVSYFDRNAHYGELDIDLQGTTVYAADGRKTPSRWKLSKIDLPVEKADKNRTVSHYHYKIDDLNEGTLTLNAKASIVGANQTYYQYRLTDFYTYKDEELAYLKKEDLQGVKKKRKAEMLTKRAEYLKTREDDIAKSAKELAENDFDMEILEVDDFKIEQTGRWHKKPEFIFSYQAKVKGPVKKVGSNYLVDVGRLIDEQIQLDEESKERDFNIYMSFARAFEYEVTLEIPEGYDVQGLENLEFNVSNDTGEFVSSATIEDNMLVVKSRKAYNSNYEPKENWGMIWEFLEAAEEFNKKQVLLKKKS